MNADYCVTSIVVTFVESCCFLLGVIISVFVATSSCLSASGCCRC